MIDQPFRQDAGKPADAEAATRKMREAGRPAESIQRGAEGAKKQGNLWRRAEGEAEGYKAQGKPKGVSPGALTGTRCEATRRPGNGRS